MSISVLDLFSIGVGPSSSHTVGPMRAAKAFADNLKQQKLLTKTAAVNIRLHGSLAWTGIGHGTDFAVLMGICGEAPDSIDPTTIASRIDIIKTKKQLLLLGEHLVSFDFATDLVFDKKELLPFHSNGMAFIALDKGGKQLLKEVYYSVGGGFIVQEQQADTDKIEVHEEKVPYPFATAAELFSHCRNKNMSISELMLANEEVFRPRKEVIEKVLKIWHVMDASIKAGCITTGELPGGLKVKRRAPELYQQMINPTDKSVVLNLVAIDALSCYAIAVNEENAAGGRVVTAPTNGAAGVVPAVLKYFLDASSDNSEDKIVEFLLTAAAIAILYKKGASISAAEVGCQGEIGVACSMAAGALAAVLDGSLRQIENAAEIGMEHHLGLTCDPVRGLVQIPCIERNAMGAVQALSAARLALREEGSAAKVSLDSVIKAMHETGKNMGERYKETSQGGLALSLPEC